MSPDSAPNRAIAFGPEVDVPDAAHLAETQSVRPVEQHSGGVVFVVDFHCNGNSATYRTFGWSGQEESHVWSVQASSGLQLPAPIETAPFVIEVDVGICSSHAFLNAAVLRLLVNGRTIGSALLNGRARVRFHLPAEADLPNQPLALHFEHPCFVRMDLLDLALDDRPLGLCFYAVRLYPPWFTEAMHRFAPGPPDFVLIEAVAEQRNPAAEAAERAIYQFGQDKAAAKRLGSGWLHDTNGDAWASAPVCTLELPIPPQGGQYIARFNLCPLYIRNFKATQRMTVLLSGAVIGQFMTGTETCLTLPLPAELINDADALHFAFAMPDGMPLHNVDPSQPPRFLAFVLDSIEIEPVPACQVSVAALRADDTTPVEPVALSCRFSEKSADELPSSVKSALGVELGEILRQFESLGDNCAFGLAQQKADCGVLGLLRFANTPLIGLMAALDDEFRAVNETNALALQRPVCQDGEYTVYVERYGIRWHTAVIVGDVDEAAIFAQQAMRLSYLRRKFYESLRSGRKIMTISRAEPRKHIVPMPFADEFCWEEAPEALRLAEVIPLFLKLNQYAANTLLFLTRCTSERPAGTVELLVPGIMRGYLNDFVITADNTSRDHVGWLQVAVNAWLLDQGPNAAFRNKVAS